MHFMSYFQSAFTKDMTPPTGITKVDTSDERFWGGPTSVRSDPSGFPCSSTRAPQAELCSHIPRRWSLLVPFVPWCGCPRRVIPRKRIFSHFDSARDDGLRYL